MTFTERNFKGMEKSLMKVRQAMELLWEAQQGSEIYLDKLDIGIGLQFNKVNEQMRCLEYTINTKVLELNAKFVQEVAE